MDEVWDDPEGAAPTPPPEAPSSSQSSQSSQQPGRPSGGGGGRAAAANLSLLRQHRHADDGPARPRGSAITLPQGDLSRQIGEADLVIPRLKISQGLSKVNMLFAQSRGKEGVQMGEWYHTTTGKSLGETIYFIPCDMRKSRSMFEAGRGLTCRSFDLLRGEGDPGILCEGTAEEIHTVPYDDRGCKFRLWSEKDGRRVPPPCGLTYNYPGFVILDPDHPDKTEMLQAMLQLRSTATGAAKSINTLFSTFGGGEWHRLILEMNVESKSNTKGMFFVPQVDLFESADEPQWARVYKRAGMFARSIGSADIRSSISPDDEDFS